MSNLFSITHFLLSVFIFKNLDATPSNDDSQRLKDRVAATISSGQSTIYGSDKGEGEDVSSIIDLLNASGVSQKYVPEDAEALLEIANRLTTTVQASLVDKRRRRAGSDFDPKQCEDDSDTYADAFARSGPQRDADDDDCHKKR